jgi:hypothetical protein
LGSEPEVTRPIDPFFRHDDRVYYWSEFRAAMVVAEAGALPALVHDEETRSNVHNVQPNMALEQLRRRALSCCDRP